MSKQDTPIFEQVNPQNLKDAMSVLRAIAHPLRLKILSFIDKHRKVSVHKIYTGLNIDQSIASQQLHILRNARLVKHERDGKYIYYAVDYEVVERINGLVENFRQHKTHD